MIWLTVAAAVVAVIAAMASLAAARRRAPSRETGRDRPPLSVAVLDADARLDPQGGTSHYALLLSFVNALAGPRKFVAVDLRIRYRTAANFSGAVDVPLSTAEDPGGARTGEVTLRLPLVLESGQSLIGWAHFLAGNVVPAGCRVDGYSVVVSGESGVQLFADAPLATVSLGAASRAAAVG